MLQRLRPVSGPGARRLRMAIRPVRSPLTVLAQGVRSFVRYRTLVRAMTTARLKVRYRQSILGWIWALLQPLALVVLYSAIFFHLSDTKPDALPYAVFVFAGVVPWAFCSTSVSTAAA